MMSRRRRLAAVLLLALSAGAHVRVSAHDGPPFPIVSDRIAGPYQVDLWTDPDATDDHSPGGQFWVMLKAADRARQLPAETQVTVRIRHSGDAGAWQSARARPIASDAGRQFAALVMDREGRFDVQVDVQGALGSGRADAWVDATYDLRPAPVMLVVYLLPFLAVGALWMKLLIKRRSRQG
jgi:hypothetical protein